jgi:hypothetical protein
MKLSIKDKKEITIWIGALRSGLFKQTIGVLQNDIGYCCLGVACELFVDDKRKIFDNEYSKELFGGLPSGQRVNSNHWLNRITSEKFEFDGKLYRLVMLNDIKKLTFKQIADIIEKQLLKD